MIERELRPKFDIDRDRIREVATEALRMAHEYVDGGFSLTKDQVMEQLERQLACGINSATFRLQMGSNWYPDMVMRIDPRRKEAMLVSVHKKATGRVNRILRAMR
jgi:hypothetical protein